MQSETPQPRRKKRPFLRFFALLLCIAIVGGVAWQMQLQRNPALAKKNFLSKLPLRLPDMNESVRSQLPFLENVAPPSPTRPYGMAPQAFAAFMRVCNRMNVTPYRIGQTIGEHPRSMGYHRRDGVLKINGQNIDYTAAVDLGAQDMNPAQLQRFLNVMAWEGFAVWYRSGPRWKNGEHIHAIYGALKMKPQLEGQVRDFLRERRRQGKKRLPWQRQFEQLN